MLKGESDHNIRFHSVPRTCVSWPLVYMLKGESDHNIRFHSIPAVFPGIPACSLKRGMHVGDRDMSSYLAD